MVLRTFPAFDNEAFTVVSSPSSNPLLDPGSPIINHSTTPVGTVFEFSNGFPYQPITLDDTSGDPDTFNDNQPGSHVIVNGQGIVPDGTQVESESFHEVRALDANGDPTGPIITITVFSQGGDFQDVWGMAADAELDDGTQYVKVGGTVVGDSDYDTFVPCFTLGTQIMTRAGMRRIEEIRPGDRVLTRDSGFKEVAWVGRRDLSAADVADEPRFAPVLIPAGSLGRGLPEHDLLLSPNHRVLLQGSGMEMAFGEPEVLAAAKHLIRRPGIRRMKHAVSYLHMMFDQHEVVLSNGAWTESFLPGAVAMSGLGTAQSAEILALFPELTDTKAKPFQAARRILNQPEAQVAAAAR